MLKGCLYRSHSLTAVAKELEGWKLHLVGVQEFRWQTLGKVRAGGCILFYGKGNERLTESLA
jgi:hypothetical protein